MRIGVRPLAPAIALLLLFGVVGLVTIDDDAGGTRLTAAAAATTAQGTARMSMTMSFDIGGQETGVSADGGVDMGSNRARMTFRSTVLPGPIEVLVDDTTVYVSATLPALQAQAAGKPWVAVDSSDSVPVFGNELLGGGSDPLQSLRLLQDKGIVRSVRENGTQDVRGVRTTRHVADVDAAEMTASVASPEAEAVADLMRDADAELEVWLDQDDVLRRSVFRISVQAMGQSISGTVTTELFDFGVAVDVAPPPADQVQRLEKLPS